MPGRRKCSRNNDKEEIRMKRLFLAMTMAASLFALLTLVQPASAADEKPIELKFATFAPPTHYVSTSVYIPWAKQIEEKTNGRVKIVFYWSETLGKAKDLYDMVLRGIADIASNAPGHTPGRFPLSEVLEILPNVPSAVVGSRVAWQLYQEVLKQEYPDVKMLLAVMVDPMDVHLRKNIKSMSDLKGLRLRASGPKQMGWVRALGASPVALGPGEVYDALQKGVIDGVVNGFSATRDFKYAEVTRSHLVLNLGSPAVMMPMNLKVWNSLRPEDQKAIEEVSGLKFSVAEGQAFDTQSQLAVEEVKKLGHNIIVPTPAERQMIVERAEPMIAGWIEDMNKKGLPGKKVYDRAIELVEQYSK
jgi:TRAP-type transport system periplasmic protein